MFNEIRAELLRIRAFAVKLLPVVRLGREPQALVNIAIGNRSCTVVAVGFLEMLKTLGDATNEVGIEAALENQASHAAAWAVG